MGSSLTHDTSNYKKKKKHLVRQIDCTETTVVMAAHIRTEILTGFG